MADPSFSLEEYLEREFPIGSTADLEDLQQILRRLGITDTMAVLSAAAAIREGSASSDTLDLRPSGWRIRVSNRVAQMVILSAVIWGGLVACGITAGIPAALVTALLPNLLDLEKVRFTRRDETIFAHLVTRHYDGIGTPDQWYNSLPCEIRSELSRLDFDDLLDKIVASGRGRDEGGEVLIFRSGNGRFAITFE